MYFWRFKSRLLGHIALPISMACVCAAQIGARSQAPEAIPDTPAGRQLAAFLVAFNTGDRAKLKAFIAGNFEMPANRPSSVDDITDQDIRLYGQSRGFTVRKIVESSSGAIKAFTQANSTGAWMEITIFVTAQPPDYVQAMPPYHIVGLGLRDIETPPESIPHRKLSESQIRARIASMMTALTADDAFSGTLYVAKNGKPLYAKAFGLASRAWNVPNRIDTRFNLASITKMFTAVAVAQLVEQGKLSYTDTVAKILPDYPNSEVARKVTIHHLLSHTSGLIGGRALAEKAPDSPTARTIDEMVRPFVHEPLSFPPGQEFDYSNAGFILLGAIIEKTSGQSYYSYVRDHIFRPAAMANTDFYELDTDPSDLAAGFEDGPNGTRLDNIFDLGVKGSPAGGAYSTGEDMTRFHMALIQHRLVSKRSLETLWTGVTEDADRGADYGYGAYIEHYDGTRIIWHGGGWKGITNQFDMYPELGYTVVVLSNYDDDPGAIANRLREWLTQGASQEKPQIPSPPILSLTAEVSSSAVTSGSPVTIRVTVKNSGGTAHAGVIDLEIKDASGANAGQQFTMGQRIDAGQTRCYAYSWIPNAAGRYTVDIGAFGPRWTPKYRFEAGAATITVR